MIVITDNYHLPNGAYWACNSKYNGISEVSKLNTGVSLREARVTHLTNLKISNSIAKQLA